VIREDVPAVIVLTRVPPEAFTVNDPLLVLMTVTPWPSKTPVVGNVTVCVVDPVKIWVSPLDTVRVVVPAAVAVDTADGIIDTALSAPSLFRSAKVLPDALEVMPTFDRNWPIQFAAVVGVACTAVNVPATPEPTVRIVFPPDDCTVTEPVEVLRIVHDWPATTPVVGSLTV
jgi:hypothetical protein